MRGCTGGIIRGGRRASPYRASTARSGATTSPDVPYLTLARLAKEQHYVAMAGSGGRTGSSSGVRPAPRAGAGPTVIAAALVVLVIGLGWLNHSGDSGGGTAFERDVAQAVEQAQAVGDIPGSDPASPSAVDAAGGSGRTTSTTIVTDPETGISITVNLPPTEGSTSASAAGGTTGTTSGPGASGGSAGTTGTSSPGTTGGTAPRPTNPPSTNPPSTNPPSTNPPSTNPPTTSDTTPTTSDTTPPPADQGLIGGLIGGLAGAVDSLL
jgi:hypothetical protein